MSCRGQATSGHNSGTASVSALSVVVVTYNEADRIEACLDAIFEACRQFEQTEVVLVDSRSTDETVSLAADYPVRVYRLPASADRTPGAGRYVGTQVTSADPVLFVDGDMIVEPSWVAAAAARLRSMPAVAGVDGCLNDASGRTERRVATLRGAVLYDRSILASIGGFDPHLQALEDVELGFRLRNAGYHLVRLPTVAAAHPFGDGLPELRRRWRSGYYFGRGQVLRKWSRSPRMVARVCHYSRLYAAMAGWTALGILATGSLGPVGLLAWCCVTAALIGVCLRLKGRTWVENKSISLVPVWAGALVGFLGPHPPPSAYPVGQVELVATPTERTSGAVGGIR